MRYALTREVSSSIELCELTHLERRPIDVARARAEHAAYRAALSELGCAVIHLPADDAAPDSVFVEDVAVVVDELAVVTRPGAASRRDEVYAIADVLGRFRRLAAIEAPATLDGGDVLRLGRRIWVGLSPRTDADGCAQLAGLLEPLGYEVVAVPVHDCLHLKSAATAIGPHTVLVQPSWIAPETFDGVDVIEVDPRESDAANALLVADALLVSSSHPLTRTRLEARGIPCRTLDASELAKAEAGLTCCSVLFDA